MEQWALVETGHWLRSVKDSQDLCLYQKHKVSLYQTVIHIQRINQVLINNQTTVLQNNLNSKIITA